MISIPIDWLREYSKDKDRVTFCSWIFDRMLFSGEESLKAVKYYQVVKSALYDFTQDVVGGNALIYFRRMTFISIWRILPRLTMHYRTLKFVIFSP
ncbi:MAG: hypothetical protein IPO03_02175 [Bacteroidetes bacterium]|nr:hypothetical protein [Bacteroidota bacterium]